MIAGMSGEAHDTCDAFATRLDARGAAVWTISLARPGFDVAHDIQPLANGNLLVFGYSFVDASRDCDAFARRLTISGEVAFDSTFGGTGLDRAIHAQVFDDGSSVFVGHSRPARDTTESWDLAVYALLPRGRALWTGRFGSPLVEFGRGIAGTRDDLWIVGHSATEDERQSDVWLLRLDATVRG